MGVQHFLKKLHSQTYLDERELKGLDEYKYHSVPGTPLDAFYDRWIWTPWSLLVPSGIHPNSLTVIGFICSFMVAYFPIAYYSPGFTSAAPAWLFPVSSLAYFSYETLDALDGKQARRLKLSSPVGQLMDHGCDSLTTFYTIYLILAASQVSSILTISVLTTSIAAILFLYLWREYHFHEFSAATGFVGVSEGHLGVYISNFVAFWRPAMLKTTMRQFIPNRFGSLLHLLFLGGELSQILVYGFSAVIWVLIVKDGRSLAGRLAKKDRARALREWALFAAHIATGFVLMMTGNLRENGFAITATVAFSGSLVAWSLIISAVARSPLKFSCKSLTPLYLLSVAIGMGCLQSSRAKRGCLRLMMGWAVTCWLRFVVVNMWHIKSYLGVSMFVVPPHSRTA